MVTGTCPRQCLLYCVWDIPQALTRGLLSAVEDKKSIVGLVFSLKDVKGPSVLGVIIHVSLIGLQDAVGGTDQAHLSPSLLSHLHQQGGGLVGEQD